MVELNNQQVPSKPVLDKSRKCFVRRLASDKYVVTPKNYSKTRRLVTFTLLGTQLFARCVNYYDPQESCPANEFGLLCYHCQAAIRRAEINARRAA